MKKQKNNIIAKFMEKIRIASVGVRGGKIVSLTTVGIIIALQAQGQTNTPDRIAGQPSPAPEGYTSSKVIPSNRLTSAVWIDGDEGDGNDNVIIKVWDNQNPRQLRHTLSASGIYGVNPSSSSSVYPQDSIAYMGMNNTGNNQCGNNTGADHIYSDNGVNVFDDIKCVGEATTMPLTYLSITTYIKNQKIHVDAEIAQARNVDRIEMQAGLSPKEMAVVDSKKVENEEAPQTFNFEMPIYEFIKQHNITSPTVVYVRLVSHDHDGLMQKSRLQSVVIHPDGTLQRIHAFPNPGSGSEIKFVVPGDGQTAHIFKLLTIDGKLIGQKIFGGGEHNLSDLRNAQPGVYILLEQSTGKSQKIIVLLIITKRSQKKSIKVYQQR